MRAGLRSLRTAGDRVLSDRGSPHRKLMAAVLRAVIDDVGDVTTRDGALAYVDSGDRLWPFSFENLCEALDMNAGDVRRQLRADPATVLALSRSDLDA